MRSDLEDIYDTAMSKYRAEMQTWQSAFANAEADGDFAARVEAAQGMARTRAEMAEFDRMTREHVASLSPPPAAAGNGVDLTPNEAAKICGVDPETYNRGVERLMGLKARGMYKDGQH
jgi:hypothetical protein